MKETQGKTWLKRAGYALGGTIAAWALFVWFGNYVAEDLARAIADRRARAFDAAIAAEKERLKRMEMADTAGGATPEETVRMIIAALEDGDIVRASTYYYVLDQEKARESFAKQFSEKKDLSASVSYFKNILDGEKECDEKTTICVFTKEYVRDTDEWLLLPGAAEPVLFSRGSKGRETGSFVLNQYTGVWKIKY